MKNSNNIEALIHLIDDPDEQVFSLIRDKLMQYGSDAIPYLESSWGEKDYGLIFLNRIEQLIHDIQFESVKTELTNWKNGQKDLLEGVIIITKHQYPGVDVQKIHDFFSETKKAIWMELNQYQTAFEKVRIINKVLFNQYQFHGDTKNFHSPLNSYINTVIETKKGNPLSISIVYSVIAQSLDLPIYGVNLPNHFILAYLDQFGTAKQAGINTKYGVLFYINPFSKGSLFDEEEIHLFLKNLNISPDREFFEPCPNTTIIRRMLSNLITSFQQAGNLEKTNELIELKSIIAD